jgi:hypothetical protein
MIFRIAPRLHSTALLALAACGMPVPVPTGLAIRVHPPTVNVAANVQVHVAAPVAVPIVDAPVVEFFGVPLDGAEDVVFVLDRSGSMSEIAAGELAHVRVAPVAVAVPGMPPPPPPPPPSKIDVAKAELIDALHRLPAGTRIDVLFFDSELEAFSADLVALDDADRAGFEAFVSATVASGSTALAPAMRTALLMNPKRVVLLSDGLGNVGGGSSAVLRDAREAIHGGVRIDTIGLGGDQDVDLLRTLAVESGGIYQHL